MKMRRRASVLILVAALALAGCGTYPSSALATLGPDAVTLDEFNQLQTGMPLAEVQRIIGSPGTPVSHAEFDGTVLTGYQWEGSAIGSNMLVTFTNDALDTKVQTGL